ncbi:MAG: hypothetical protein J3K34DRAFT_12107 [Monoraphidium minutum]|nr:MAG: hypothetical protein J3K34DRAFT_12107 [Monoraphidium minutum]
MAARAAPGARAGAGRALGPGRDAPIEYGPAHMLPASWPDRDPDFAAAFPISDRYLGGRQRPPRRAAAAAAAAAGGGGRGAPPAVSYDDDKPWMTPRIAFKLYSTAVFLSDVAQHSDPDALDLPPVAAPFVARRAWRRKLAQAFLRIAGRLANGLEPGPNCTGEEMAFHLAVDWAREYDWGGNDEESAQLDRLPQAEMDDDWELVQDAAVQDEDVLMLFDDKVAPQLLAGGTLAAVMGVTHLHPSECEPPPPPRAQGARRRVAAAGRPGSVLTCCTVHTGESVGRARARLRCGVHQWA